MKKLSFEKMENLQGGCPGIGCMKVGVWAVCYDVCDGQIMYVEPW